MLAASLYLFLCIRYICKDSGIGLCHMLLVTGPGQSGALSNQQVVASSSRPGCVQKEPSCTSRPALISTGPRGESAEVNELPKIHFIC